MWHTLQTHSQIRFWILVVALCGVHLFSIDTGHTELGYTTKGWHHRETHSTNTDMNQIQTRNLEACSAVLTALHHDPPSFTGFIHIWTSQIPGLSGTFQCKIQGPFQWIHKLLTRRDTPIFRKKCNDWIPVRLWLKI